MARLEWLSPVDVTTRWQWKRIVVTLPAHLDSYMAREGEARKHLEAI
jgi:hypothetical protein